MTTKPTISNKKHRINLVCNILDVLACEAVECIENKEGTIGIGEFQAWIQLENTQQLLVLNRLAECVVDGKLGFYPNRAYGDAAIRVMFNELRDVLGCELQNEQSQDQDIQNTQNNKEDSKSVPKTLFRDLIIKAVWEMNIIDSPDDTDQFDDLDDAIWEIEESFVDRTDHDKIEPYFWTQKEQQKDEYWFPLMYVPADHSTSFLISRLRQIVAPLIDE